MKILFVSPLFVLPIIGGDSLKGYQILKMLSKKHEVTLITLSRKPSEIDDFDKKIKCIVKQSFIIQTGFELPGILALLKSLFRHPIEAEFFNRQSLRNRVNRIFESGDYDLVIGYYHRVNEIIKDIPKPKMLILDDSRILYQGRIRKHVSSLAQRLYRNWEYYKMQKYEPNAIEHYDVVTAVTEDDVLFLRKLNAKANIELITNGVEIDCPDNAVLPATKDYLLFLGKLSFEANKVMVGQILNDIMPNIWKKHPGMKLKIVGSNPTEELKRKLNEHTNTELIDNPVSVVEYYRNALLLIHPHYSGTGIQNKVLEAMANECAVVTTEIGCQGIVFENELHGYICKNNSEIVEKTISLIEDKNKAIRMGKAARNSVQDNHTWAQVNKQLDEVIAKYFK